MNEPTWLSIEIIQAIHSQSIAWFGGGDGLRDQHALETSLNRPHQHYNYANPQPSLFEIAAVYCSGSVKSHSFIDGNKRTGFMAAYTFLGINGYQLIASEEEAALIVLALADRRLSDEELAAWLRANCQRAK
ncbi:type II toxin-antitoxin system death-on-curing family toxin [Coraliomargarita akajimensis]|uniref:Death-on-curing family protein n=1 Tax=Coraliomargarita akajimensis (strain DSM 45221 / IAM 15411 / JCM 23193 / KCTC 12865 / 04OKA010-24) TaxID=583355 RepID=D5ELE9_CORAD|nr:type II toxin-antitoxin system death-on-curing family toxin [Coraliomargarita akajimensis]ADE55085.1 death-on-curing family protein [Coraliomargarita akajimensis DSM 45221]